MVATSNATFSSLFGGGKSGGQSNGPKIVKIIHINDGGSHGHSGGHSGGHGHSSGGHGPAPNVNLFITRKLFCPFTTFFSFALYIEINTYE